MLLSSLRQPFNLFFKTILFFELGIIISYVAQFQKLRQTNLVVCMLVKKQSKIFSTLKFVTFKEEHSIGTFVTLPI